jgi:NCS1 family nucleobase:cation symporter-1
LAKPSQPTGVPYPVINRSKGYNPAAIIATVVGAVVAVIPVLATGLPGMHTTAQYSWFIGMGLVTYLGLAARLRVAP